MALSKQQILKLVVAIVGLIAGIIIAQTEPPEMLDQQAMLGLGIFVCFLMCSMVEVFPDYICWLLMCTSWAAFKCVPFAKAFGFYTSTSWFLMLGAMVLAAAVAHTGLLKRIALTTMTKFPVTYNWQITSLIVTGAVLTPLIPSNTVKSALFTPYAVSVSDSLGFKRRSVGATGLFAAAWLSVGLIAPAVLSASFTNYVIQGTLKERAVSYMDWFIGGLPWLILMLIVGFFAIRLFYKAPASSITATNSGLVEERKALGVMSRNEKITMFVLAFCLVLWMTEKLHGINSALTVLMGVAILCSSGVLDRKAFRAQVTWDAMIFLGCALSLSTALPAMGIDKWISSIVSPIVVPLMTENFYLFIAVFCAIVYLVRVFFISYSALVALFMVFLVPSGVDAGVNPWILGFITFTAGNCFALKYQNVTYLPGFFAAQTAAGEDFIEHKHIVKFGVYYLIGNIIFLCACVPFWRMLGWLP